ncbi:hypothetical protein BaRGS_00036471, partial [Batillaria attramentaria]
AGRRAAREFSQTNDVTDLLYCSAGVPFSDSAMDTGGSVTRLPDLCVSPMDSSKLSNTDMVGSSKDIPTNVLSNGESTSCDINVETDNESVDGHACLAGSHEDNGGTGVLCMNSVTKSLAFLNWNVDGLLSKLEDGEFIDYVASFDLVCLVETFVDSFSSSVFP